jgi:hypothetical protein
MLQKLTLLIAGLILSGVALAQISEKTHNVGSFSSIDVGSAFEVVLTQGNKNEVIVEADDNIMDQIDVSVKSNKLVVKTNGNIRNPKKMKLYITFQSVEAMNFSGASKASATTPIKANQLKIDLSGASKLDLEINTSSLSLDLSGASRCELKGSADEFKIDTSGASRIGAFGLQTKTTKVSASGASKIEVSVSHNLSVSASGASNIQYKGAGSISNISTSGASNVRKVN